MISISTRQKKILIVILALLLISAGTITPILYFRHTPTELTTTHHRPDLVIMESSEETQKLSKCPFHK